MKTAQHKPADDLRMSSKAFDKIMRRALQVQPEEAAKAQRSTKAKPKAVRSKKRAAK